MILSLCIFITLIQLSAALLLRFYAGKSVELSDKRIEKISVLIPFHNEAERISELIETLNKSSSIPGELIFINDHSTDDTVQHINDGLKVPFRIINNENKKGKKYAIRCGVHAAKEDYILTLDADVRLLSVDYFSAITQMFVADLIIMPVTMQGTTVTGKLAAIEFSFLQTLGLALNRIGRPVLCNGANLVFNKASFLKVEADRNDYEIPSGDDLYLLKALRYKNYKISSVVKEEVIVSTKAPMVMTELRMQRQRWARKMADLMTTELWFALGLLLLVQFTFIVSATGLFYDIYFFIPLLLKIIAERIITFQKEEVIQNKWMILLLHQFWYPVYLMISVIPAPKEKKWT